MPLRVLWLDNDLANLDPWVETLRDEGYETNVVETVAEAEKELKSSKYDLLILDVMIPTMNDQEELRYKPEITALGNKTGLLFYKFNKEVFERTGTKVLIMTVRLDKVIMDEFINAGLPKTSYATKYELRKAPVFIKKIQSILHGVQSSSSYT